MKEDNIIIFVHFTVAKMTREILVFGFYGCVSNLSLLRISIFMTSWIDADIKALLGCINSFAQIYPNLSNLSESMRMSVR